LYGPVDPTGSGASAQIQGPPTPGTLVSPTSPNAWFHATPQLMCPPHPTSITDAFNFAPPRSQTPSAQSPIFPPSNSQFKASGSSSNVESTTVHSQIRSTSNK
uniref:Synaptopodin 2-like n=1 Tax=Rodentolepis nana TaxID=102285 RepID=A0A0R3THG5_RODNA